MNRTKRSFTIAVAVFLIASALGAGNAFAGPRGPHGRFFRNPLARLMLRLDLTEAQKTTLAGIVKQNEANAKSIATGLANARVQLARDVLNGSGSSVIAADSQNVATYAAQAAQLRAQIMAQMIPALSPEQKTRLQEIHDKIGSNVNAAIAMRFSRLDRWIARHQ